MNLGNNPALYVVKDAPDMKFTEKWQHPALKAAMEADGTEQVALPEDSNSGAVALIDFGQNGTMYVLVTKSNMVYRFMPTSAEARP